MYNQSLVNTVEPVKKTTISRLNKGKKWKYGYDKERLYRVLSNFITIKYEYQGDEEEYNPSWANSS